MDSCSTHSLSSFLSLQATQIELFRLFFFDFCFLVLFSSLLGFRFRPYTPRVYYFTVASLALLIVSTSSLSAAFPTEITVDFISPRHGGREASRFKPADWRRVARRHCCGLLRHRIQRRSERFLFSTFGFCLCLFPENVRG